MICDVLIIGGGLAGMMAARGALSEGLKTVLVRDGLGASPWVHGFNHPVREGDSPEAFLGDVLRSGQGLCDPVLARALCGDSAAVFDELNRMGLVFNRDPDGGYQALRPLGASFPRVVSIGNETGTAILNALSRALSDRLIVLDACRALRLYRDSGRVTGALIYHRREQSFEPVFAKAVILAGGGFCGIYPLSTNKRDSGGDMAAIAYEAGAELTDMEFIQFEPSASLWPPALNGTSMITTLFYEGAVLRNAEGERFLLRYGGDAERVSKDVLARRIAEEVLAGHGTPHGGVYMDVTGVDPGVLDRDYPMYVRRYADVGIDLKTEWIELGPAPHTSIGGVRTDENCRTGLKGLYACGECMGGLHGANRVGGNGGLEALVFGRRAGISAAADVPDAPAPREIPVSLPAGSAPDPEAAERIRADMGRCLQRCAGVIRDGRILEAGIRTLQALREEAFSLPEGTAEDFFRVMRLRNDLTCALLVATAAYERDETVGCHVRSDCPSRAEENYRIILHKGDRGPITERMSIRA